MIHSSSYKLFCSSKTVLLTGASRGIGKAISEQLTNLGLQVWAPTRSELNLQSEESVKEFIKNLENSTQPAVDILINNAGVNFINSIENLKDAELKNMWQVNVLAPTQLVRAVFPSMKKKRWGRIINIGSIFGVVSRAERAAYSSTKAALHGLTQAAAIEGAADNILVNTVCPGYTNTELTQKNNPPAVLQTIQASIPMQRLAEPAEIAECVAFLVSERNTYLTGQSIAVDGGFLCR